MSRSPTPPLNVVIAVMALLAGGPAPAAEPTKDVLASGSMAMGANQGQTPQPLQTDILLATTGGPQGTGQPPADRGGTAAIEDTPHPLPQDDVPPVGILELWRQHRVAGTLLAGSLALVAALLLLLAHRNRQLEGNAQALKASEKRFRSLFARNSSVMLLIDPESGRIEDANPAAAAFYGHPLERLVGMSIDDINLLPPEALADERRRAETEKCRYFQFQHRLANGNVRDVEVYSTPIQRDASTLLFSIIHDITERRRAEDELRTLSGHFMTLLDNATDFIYFKDADSRFIFASRTLAELTGHAHWRDLVGKHDTDVFPADLARIYEEGEIPVFRDGVAVLNRVDPYYGHDGRKGWVSTNKWPVMDEQTGAVVGICGISRDITEQQQTEERLHLAASVFTYAREGIFITDGAGTIIEVNDAFCHITGYGHDEVLGQNPRILKSGHQDEAFYTAMWQDLEAKDHWYGEVWNRRKDGEVYAALLTISAVRNASGEARRYVALFSDITSQKQQQQRLEHIAHYDALTDLPNRVLLADRLKHAMAQAQRRGQRLAVVFLDLDGFKEINDSRGHEVGDQLLITVARRLLQSLRESDTIARLGGDEFVAVLNDITDDVGGAAMLGRLLGAAAQPVTVDGHTLQVTASAGVAYYPQTEEVDADQLLRQADQAMYRAKLAGKNCYQLFDAEQDRATRGHHEGIERISRSLENDELELHYQPRVHMRSGEIMGVEALVRWRHPERGLLVPAEFLPLIGNHVLDLKVGEWVLGAALDQLAAWQAQGLRLTTSINISALQLQQSNFVTHLQAAFGTRPTVTPELLELEVLESAALEDIDQVSRVMSACRDLGVRLTLDDFGTGYSSLSYFKRLPASQIKIDRSFVRDMLEDPEDLAILEGILGLATAFGRTAIAEGVETVAHGSLLLQLGCELAQGFAIARPMAATEIPGWVTTWRPFPEWTRQRAVSRDDLPLLYAAVEHRASVRALEEYLGNRRPTPPPLDHQQCRFGQWLDREPQRREQEGPAFHAIVDLDRQTHAKARELIALKDQNQEPEVLKGLEALKALQDELVGRLQALAQTEDPSR